MGSHGYFLQLQGEQDAVVAALSRADLAGAPVTPAERALLEFVELVTRHAYKTTPEVVESVRAAGWSDEQIAEAVYITALFAFFNRVADVFGLADPNYFALAAQGKAPQPMPNVNALNFGEVASEPKKT